ncbi:MAG: hypothetical protein R3F42_05225 [Pseudomonadota bacterium]
MRTRLERYLLILVCCALAVAPLQPTFARLQPAAASALQHCPHMQVNLPRADEQQAALDSDGGVPARGCKGGCGGGCCHGACPACAHVVLALPAAATIATIPAVMPPPPQPTLVCSGRTVNPPFRPPINLS